jgi:hypothetical protein
MSNLNNFLSGFAEEDQKKKEVFKESEKPKEVPQEPIQEVKQEEVKPKVVERKKPTIKIHISAKKPEPRIDPLENIEEPQKPQPKPVESEKHVQTKPVSETLPRQESKPAVNERPTESIQKPEEDKAADVEKLFKSSETNEEYRELWMSIYNKALNKTSNGNISKKILNGRFRINKDGKLEILPNFPTFGKTSNQLMQEKWDISPL